MNIVISFHGHDRVKKRAGKKLNPMVLANNAYSRGLKHTECKGNLKKWVDKFVLKSQTKCTPFVYDNQLFLFGRSGRDEDTMVLVTVIPVPANLYKLVRVCEQKKKLDE